MFLTLFFLINAGAQEIPVYKTPPVLVTPGSFREPEPDTIVELPVEGTSKAATLDDALRGASGVVVSRGGGTGQPSSVFVRGAASEHTLVLLDGVEMNDPSSPGGGFDFSTVDLNLVEKVEIFKGPQTLRYGSGALGGVVNIVTKKGGGRKTLFTGRAGSHQTHQVTATRLGKNYSLSATRFETSGISAAAKHPELDGHRYVAAALRASIPLTEKWELDWISRVTAAESELDYAPSNSGPHFLEADDPNYQVDTLGLVNALKGQAMWTERWKSNFSLSHYYMNRTYNNPADEVNPATFRDDRHANTLRLENVNSYAANSRATFSFGPSFRSERAQHSSWSAGFFGDAALSRRPFFLNTGGRVDVHQKFGEHFTYAFTPGVRLWEATTVTARWATAFKSPSLFQLFDPTFGNENLNPERVRGEEVSVEQGFGEHIALKATAFQYHYADMIQFANRYQNVAEARTRGAELEYSQKLGWLGVQGAYTYTDARNLQTGARLIRRPFNSWRAGVNAEVTDYLKLRGEYRGAGSRPDLNALSFTSITTPGYEVADISAALAFDKKTQVTASVENVFDRRYQEINGYGTSGLGVYFGLKTEL